MNISSARHADAGSSLSLRRAGTTRGFLFNDRSPTHRPLRYPPHTPTPAIISGYLVLDI